jgi:hypothetical protein
MKVGGGVLKQAVPYKFFLEARASQGSFFRRNQFALTNPRRILLLE